MRGCRVYYEPYNASQLHLAYCHRVHFRFQTHCRLPQSYLEGLRQDEFQASLDAYGIRLLDVASDEVDLVCQVSLRPAESVSGCASKFKGRLSKWLRTAQGLDAPTKLLATGYLACTVGDPTRKDIEGYIGRQGEHHGYSQRPLPPVLVEEYPLPAAAAVRLDAAHNLSLLRYHLVFGTMCRRGVFTQAEAAGVVAAWRGVQAKEQFALLKVSVVPDHVHMAVRVHPAVAPLALAERLMNVAQEVMFEQFPEVVIRYSANRLWENGAYVGSFGELSSRAVRAALAQWRGQGA